VNAAPEWRQNAEAPVAELVAAPLDQDFAIVRDNAGGGVLIIKVTKQVHRSRSGQAMIFDELRVRYRARQMH
jgi:hypothetical protein